MSEPKKLKTIKAGPIGKPFRVVPMQIDGPWEQYDASRGNY